MSLKLLDPYALLTDEALGIAMGLFLKEANKQPPLVGGVPFGSGLFER